MITVLPEGGLCNRLRVVASSWQLARASGQAMKVLWFRTPDFNARFAELFEVASLPFAVCERNAWTRAARALFRVREALAHARGDLVIGESEAASGKFDLANAAVSLAAKRVFIRTNSRLACVPGMFDIFEPGLDTKRSLAVLAPRLVRSIGVHVRRSDNSKATSESTIARFIQLMQAEVEMESSIQFFVATDGADVLDALRSEFGERIWEYPKRAHSRDDPVAIADAVIDLYALARTRKLIGSYWSSFTDTAAELHGVPLIIARQASASQIPAAT